jgi:hypothetical protein
MCPQWKVTKRIGAKDLQKRKGEAFQTEVNELQLYPVKGFAYHNIMIVAFLGESVKTYQTDFIYFLARLSLICTICHEECKSHAWCNRKACTGDEICVLRLLRVKCDSCGRTHIVLPDFLRPYGRYTQDVRQEAVLACMAGVPIEKATRYGQAVETVRRWVAQYQADKERVAAVLRSLLAQWGRYPSLGRSSLPNLTQACEETMNRPGIMSSGEFGKINILLVQAGLPVWI